ncbi:cardiac-enriched FHL2-interacting protein-like [Festucalex cinctus]
MTSLEKRRSNRKNGGHRKHSDGGFSDTSSSGSFLDETDREVRSLTDKAFRSLCIGEEAIYNDSDLGPSSPCIQRDRQQAFNKSGLEKENGDREELKRAAHESFSLMVQQYEQDWIHDGMYGAEMNRNPQWDVYGDGTQGRVSATFQHSLMEMTPEDRSLEEDPFSYFSNGATDLSLQHRRSRSRVSSLIRAFNTEDGAVMEDQLREWNEEARWNRPDLMNMPSPYQQNFTNGQFSMVGQFSSQDNNLYSSEAAAVSHMNAASSFMGLTYNNQHMMTQLDCDTNFFIHSEFSPFRVWRDHNRFQQGEVSRYMQCSEFPKWGQTPMYKELSLESQMNGSSMFQERSGRHHRTRLTPVAPNPSLQSISTSTRLQKACALEKRCESEQAVHYPQRIRTQSLGTDRLPPHRPSTASPTVEMSYYAPETLNSVEALHQQIKIMTEQNNNPEKTANRHGVITPSNDGQLLLPLLPMSQAKPPESRENAGSPQIVEHPPVRAESRGGTPDVRMSSYKSRASSLLFNLKDNRKRVKSTYSPAKFKGCETTEKSREPPLWESKDIVIDIPECLQADIQESSWIDGASHQYVKPDHSPRLFSPGMNSQPNTRQVIDYKTAQRQDETVHQFGRDHQKQRRRHLPALKEKAINLSVNYRKNFLQNP